MPEIKVKLNWSYFNKFRPEVACSDSCNTYMNLNIFCLVFDKLTLSRKAFCAFSSQLRVQREQDVDLDILILHFEITVEN